MIRCLRSAKVAKRKIAITVIMQESVGIYQRKMICEYGAKV